MTEKLKAGDGATAGSTAAAIRESIRCGANEELVDAQLHATTTGRRRTPVFAARDALGAAA